MDAESIAAVGKSERSLEDGPEFKFLIAYDHKESGLRAMDSYDRMLKQLGLDPPIAFCLWNIGVLEASELAATAAQDAMTANVVLISLVGDRAPSARFRSWLNMWGRKDRAQPTAFAVVLSPEYRRSSTGVEIALSLRQFASFAGLDYLSDNAATAAPHGNSFENLRQRAEQLSSVLDGILNHSAGQPPRFGVDESSEKRF